MLITIFIPSHILASIWASKSLFSFFLFLLLFTFSFSFSFFFFLYIPTQRWWAIMYFRANLRFLIMKNIHLSFTEDSSAVIWVLFLSSWTIQNCSSERSDERMRDIRHCISLLCIWMMILSFYNTDILTVVIPNQDLLENLKNRTFL